MAFPVSLLTTRALCDEATAVLDAGLAHLTVRQTNYDHRNDKATDRATDISDAITVLDQDITDLTTQLAGMAADSTYRPRREAELRAATKRRGDLGAAQTTRAPVAAFRLAVEARQVTAQTAERTQAKTEVATHRATLSA